MLERGLCLTCKYQPEWTGENKGICKAPRSANLFSSDIFPVKLAKETKHNEVQVTCNGQIVDECTAHLTVAEEGGDVEEPGTPEDVAVSSITVSPTSVDFKVGEIQALTITITPNNATNKDYTITANPTGVVAIEGDSITAEAEGSTTLTIQSSSNAEKTATVAVTVSATQNLDEEDLGA